MAKLPRNQEVVQAIRSLAREVKLATKEANQLAAKRLARGDYAGAQSLIDVAQAISEFGNEVLGAEWPMEGSPFSRQGTEEGKG